MKNTLQHLALCALVLLAAITIASTICQWQHGKYEAVEDHGETTISGRKNEG